MRTLPIATTVSLASLGLLLACESPSHPAAPRLQAMSFANSEWSEPVDLGPVVNFSSNGPGGSGPLDIWVSQRTCADPNDPACAWQAPVNLGSPINSAGADFAPNLSRDGHLLFFASNRGGGATDIFVSHRADPNDDFGWDDPVPLGPGVNTAAAEQAPMYLQNAEDGSANLYFNRGALAQNQAAIYVAAVTRDGETLGPAQLA